ncbi:MAG: nucleoside triphosphate pyrophosphohydrolase family protein [bacterium]
MSANDYQAKCREFAIYPNERAVEYLALGLASEAGEVAGKIKKQIRDGRNWTGEQREDHRQHILAEMGDVCFYLAELCSHYGVGFGEVMSGNIAKLESRRDRGVIGGSGDKR